MGTEIGRLAVYFSKIMASDAQSQRVTDLTKDGGKWEQGMRGC